MDDEAEKRILAIIQRGKIDHSGDGLICPRQAQAEFKVVHLEAEFGADPIKHNTKAAVEEAIWKEIHKKIFFSAEEVSYLSRQLKRRVWLLRCHVPS